MPFPPEHLNLKPCPIHHVEPTMTEQQLSAMDRAGEVVDPPLFRSEPRERAVGWQPIKTAPKDGTAVLGYQMVPGDLRMVTPAYFTDGKWQIVCYHEGNVEYEVAPTHWMPLPPAPTSQEKDHG